MLQFRRISILILLIIFSILLWYYKGPNDETTIQFFPINESVTYTDVGSDLQVFERDDRYIISAESWSKTSEKVYLRQDVILLFRNGFLIKMEYPWKEQTDWIVDKIEENLESESIYTLLTFHHAEIHKNEIITSKQFVTFDKLYVIDLKGDFEAFKKPDNARQSDEMKKLNEGLEEQRNILLEKGIKELNINKSNYEIYDLDVFSLKQDQSKIIPEDSMDIILGGLWEGLYRSYVHGYSKDELKLFSPPMPWILVDGNGTHMIILYQLSNGGFEKLILEI